ncbi:hypothetical protein E3O19_13595 [Cryobacterium algoritolerans]|uniref:Uncharacterized protein n=1 Tax=Cryobacterium algoritolerans TaxID=1259184 RepID=A0A4R8WPI0_9MICO|nr:hypothetical protein [Cryobacterium algoritolerans]TFC12257.1 hypothetical protein E3O19_13595 [Cryobacterium algoritolerans]
MSEFASTGQDPLESIGPEPVGPEPVGPEAATTGFRPVLPAGVDEDLPDDADDVSGGVPPPRASPRVEPEESAIHGPRRRRGLRRWWAPR